MGDSPSHLGTRGAFTHRSRSEWAPLHMSQTYSTYCEEALGTSCNVNHPRQRLLATGCSSGSLCGEGV